MLRITGIVLFCLLFAFPAQARHRQVSYAAHPMCNILWPCEGVTTSPRGERVVRDMGGFGTARQRYTPAVHHVERARLPARQISNFGAPSPSVRYATERAATIVAHPEGCPHTAFCGCGAAVRVFGHAVRELWLASNWFKFPRSSPAPGMVAVRSHHVFVLEADLGGGVWQVYDANSGGHATRIHARSIAGYTIVNPRA